MTALQYEFKLSEEIARWAFEVHLASIASWHLAFTNPTAGPWKRLMALNPDGVETEVHRFEREEDRPDLVLVNDELRAVVIVEAKDALPALVASRQVAKSCAVVNALSGTLASLLGHAAWGTRTEYTVVPGLLWGANAQTDPAAREAAFAIYSASLSAEGFDAPGWVGIEVLRSGDELAVNVTVDAAGSASPLVKAVAASLSD